MTAIFHQNIKIFHVYPAFFFFFFEDEVPSISLLPFLVRNLSFLSCFITFSPLVLYIVFYPDLSWFVVVVVTQSCPNFVTSWTAAYQAPLSFTISWSLLKLMSIESVMPPNHLAFCHLLLPLPSMFLSLGVFSNETALNQVSIILDLQLQHQHLQWIFMTDFL